MSIYDKISKMLGSESDEEKLYKVLNADEYKERPYEYKDLGEGMAVIGETMCGGGGGNIGFLSITTRNVPMSSWTKSRNL